MRLVRSEWTCDSSTWPVPGDPGVTGPLAERIFGLGAPEPTAGRVDVRSGRLLAFVGSREADFLSRFS